MSTVYDVIVRLKSEGSFNAAMGKTAATTDKVVSNLGAASMGLSALGSAASGVAGVFTGMVEKAAGVAMAVGKIAAVGALGAVAYGVVGINNELEKTQIGLAAVFGANGVTANMTEGLGLAKDIMGDMRKDAAALPGEFKDLAMFFRMGANPGLKDGMGVHQLEKLSANAMAASASLNMPMEQAAREFGMLLQGRAGAHNILGTQLGINAKGFNSASGQDRVKQITDALGKFEPAIAAFSHSWDGLTSTARDNIKRFLGLATEPLFDKLKDRISLFNDSMDGNADKVEAFANAIGGKLARGFGSALDYIQGWWPAIQTFAANAEDRIGKIWASAQPFLDHLTGTAKNFLGDPGAIDKIEGVLKMYALVKGGGALLGAAGGIGGSVGGIGKAAASALGAGAETGPVGLAIELAALETAFVALSAVAVAAYGAMDSLSDVMSGTYGYAVEAWNGIKDNVAESMNSLGQAWDSVQPIAKAFADVTGTLALGALQALTWAVSDFASAMSTAASIVGTAAAAVGITAPVTPKTGRQGKDSNGGTGDLAAGVTTATLAKGLGDGLDKHASKTARGAGGGGGGTHIQKVEIVVNQNDDPSRVARHVVNKLADLSRNPTVSRYRPNWSTGAGTSSGY